MPIHSKSLIAFPNVVFFIQCADKSISVLTIVNAELGSFCIKFDSSSCWFVLMGFKNVWSGGCVSRDKADIFQCHFLNGTL